MFSYGLGEPTVPAAEATFVDHEEEYLVQSYRMGHPLAPQATVVARAGSRSIVVTGLRLSSGPRPDSQGWYRHIDGSLFEVVPGQGIGTERADALLEAGLRALSR